MTSCVCEGVVPVTPTVASANAAPLYSLRMRIDAASIPFAARAVYGVRAGAPLQVPQRPSSAPLVAASVPGRVDFTHDASTSAMRLHAHPAEGNAAATGIAVGRIVDLQA